MKNVSFITLLTYIRYVKDCTKANLAYNPIISNTKKENAIYERYTSEPKHIPDIINNWKHHFYNHTL